MLGILPNSQLKTVDWSNWSGLEVGSTDQYQDTEFVGSRWTGAHHDQNGGPLEGSSFRNCRFRWAEKWLARMYRVRQILFENCEFLDVLHEHACYFNVAGGLAANETSPEVNIEWRDCLFRDISSQAIQIVFREGETPEPSEDAAEGLGIKVTRTMLENIGASTGNHRASFALSFFASPNDVWLSRVILNNRMQRTSRGALLCQERMTARSRLFVEDSVFYMGVLEQPMAKIEGTKEVILHGSEFICAGGQNWIDIQNAEKVRITNCGGNVVVKRNGVNLGLIESLDLREV